MKLVRHGNGQMAKNLTTGKFQNVSSSSPGWQLRKTVFLQSTVVHEGCVLYEQINLFCMLTLCDIKKSFNILTFSLCLLGIHAIKASSNWISVNSSVSNRLRDIPGIMMMRQKSPTFPTYIYILLMSEFWEIISSPSPHLHLHQNKEQYFQYLIRSFYGPERKLAPELKMLILFSLPIIKLHFEVQRTFHKFSVSPYHLKIWS